MPHIHETPFGIRFKSKVSPEEIQIQQSSLRLCNTGYNMPVQISVANEFLKRNPNKDYKRLLVFGHLDTGANITCIDLNLAKYLEIPCVGESSIKTASSYEMTPDYAVNISFAGSPLRTFENLKISSCNLRTDLEKCLTGKHDPKNIGLLIGRDIMSMWNITWHGPTSAVFISD